MTIFFSCNSCQQIIQTESIASGFSFHCPTCDNILKVPINSTLIAPSIIKIDPKDIIVNRDKKYENAYCPIHPARPKYPDFPDNHIRSECHDDYD